MRGTFKASAIVAKDKSPSIGMVSNHGKESLVDKLTHSCHDLRLHPKLVGKASSEISNPTFTIARNVGNLSNVVEHVATREQENGNKTDASPEITILNHREDIGFSEGNERDQTEH